MLSRFKKWSLPNVSIALTMLLMTIVSHNMNWGKNHWTEVMQVDAKGYYAYLPAIFIYHDLNYGFFDKIETEKYYNKNLFYDYRIGSNGHVINKYYCGTALAQLPFFLVAHTFCNFSDYEPDGYSKPYVLLITIAALFYLLVGLVYIDKTLRLFGIGQRARTIVPFAVTLGTNLFFSVVGEPGMSHIYSFAFVSMFIYFSKQYFLTHELRNAVVIASIFGIILIIRPVNGLILFSLPFLAGSAKALGSGLINFFNNPKWVGLSFIVAVAIISIQLIIYKISTDNFFVYSYGEESFNFMNPHIIDILFSYRKGLFLYTPLYLMSLAGLYFLWQKRSFELYAITGFLLLLTYVLSSWWMWYYGGSFSSRVYVEYLPLFMILFAFALDGIKHEGLRAVYFTLIFVFVALCQIQTYQYRYYQIHWSDMTKEKYWEVFLRLDKLIK